ncbi:MAG TPA: glycine--tRNA ligase, partial [Ignisphaera sp.]|nr:glycine--tRNA ligase [Ignisphaera sp.]
MAASKYEKIIDLALRRGFLWQSFEIYGGQAGFYDLGPLGVLLKNNIVELWRQFFVKQHQEFVVEIETPMITPAIVFKASGHEESFTDYAVSCLKCGRVYRADHLVEEFLNISAEGLSDTELEELIRKHNIKCPVCGGELSNVKRFLLLFQTFIGPYSPENLAYLRPEAAQGMFINFKRVYEIMRRRMPLGIAQIGRVARNEISPRQGPIRLREFTIMEIEFFYDDQNPQADLLYERCSQEKIRILTAEQRRCGEEKPLEIAPSEAYDENIIKSPWLAYWMCIANKFVQALGIPFENIYFEEKLPQELAHYSKQTFDQIVLVDKWGKLEVSGHAYRYTYDLEQHMKYSKADLYALRQLKEPRRIKKVSVKYDKKRIIEIFGSRAREV